VPTSDTQLLRAVANGDSEALAELYDRYHSILFGLLLRILRDGAEAEDVLQEVFIQTWRRASSFDETRGKAFTWLVTIARSRAIDRLRSRSAQERTALRAAPDPLQEVSDASDDAIRSEESEKVRRALMEIPEEQRQTLLLAYFEGLSQTEIAEQTKTPLGTVKTRTRSGLLRLRELLRRGR
jgi:RNA polymerase sigma-70 factor (ECF subfamily)